MNKELVYEKIKQMALERKCQNYIQEDIAQMTGISRSNIANFERGRVDNMFLYHFYLTKFGSENN